jgi:hypothetical protein
MAKIEVTEVEEQLNHRLLFNVRVSVDKGQIDFPIGIQDQGSPARNEAAVLMSTLSLAEEIAASARLRLGAGTHL